MIISDISTLSRCCAHAWMHLLQPPANILSILTENSKVKSVPFQNINEPTSETLVLLIPSLKTLQSHSVITALPLFNTPKVTVWFLNLKLCYNEPCHKEVEV